MNNPSDERMYVVGQGDLVHPGSCMICGNGNYERGYVNLGVWYEYEGNMYMCGTCLEQAAALFGMLTSEESQHLRDSANKALAECAALNTELEETRARLRVFDDAVAHVLSSSSLDPAVSEAEGVKSLSNEGPVSSGAPGEPESKESTEGAKRTRPNRVKLSDVTEPVEGDGQESEPGIL